MRQIEHAVIVILFSAVVALSWLIVRHRCEEGEAAVAEVPGFPKAAPAPSGGGAGGVPEADPVPVESRARAYQEVRAREVRDSEQREFDRLLEVARSLLQSGGVDELLWAPFPGQAGSGNDEDLRRLVEMFGAETDPARLWAIAQRIRFHLTAPRGRLWTVDQEAVRAFERFAVEDADPLKRQVALGAFGSTGWGGVEELVRGRMMGDPDARVRATAAGLMRPPQGVSEADARPVADRFREMLADADPNVRAAAARGFGGWAYREEDVDALSRAARTDASEAVRLNAAGSLSAAGTDAARRALADLANDPAQPAAVRDAARAGLKAAGVVPSGLEDVRVIRTEGE